MGEKVDFEDGDTSKKKMIFLSETIAKYYVDYPKHTKVEVVSTKGKWLIAMVLVLVFHKYISFYSKHYKNRREA
jgi:hypothetical protein